MKRAATSAIPRAGVAILVIAGFLAIAGGLASCGPKARPGIPPRHLLLVTVAAMRADHSSTWMHARPTTAVAADPLARKEGRAMGLDDLAASGVVFANAFAPSCRTVPALASLFTGRAPVECGVTNDDEIVGADVPTLAELFANGGYRTAAFVTRTDLPLEFTVGRGFSTFQTCANDRETLLAAAAWSKLDPGDGTRRMLWVHLAGLEPPWNRAANSEWVDEQLSQRDFGPDPDPETLRALVAGERVPDERDREMLSRRYDRELTRTTHSLAEFLRTVYDYYQPDADTSETWARTVFVFAGTTGVLLGEDGMVGHRGTLHEHALHVPLVMRHPDSLTGERVFEDVVELADVLPTLVEWFDLATPRRVQGRSLLALTDSYEARTFEPRPAIASLDDRHVSARDERFHLVMNPFGKRLRDRPVGAKVVGPSALFEPARDPLERDDVTDDFPYSAGALRKQLDQVLRRETRPYTLNQKRRVTPDGRIESADPALLPPYDAGLPEEPPTPTAPKSGG